LAQLAAMESDEKTCAFYRKGLERNAARAVRFIEAYKQFTNQNDLSLGYANWRHGYHWKPQETQGDAERVASLGKKKVLGTRKGYERSTVTNPLSAAAIVALAGDGTGRREIESAIAHYDYSKINICEFFIAEVAYYALPLTASP